MSKSDCCNECKICNKKYASYNSLWNHNKKYHSDVASKCNTLVVQCIPLEDNLKCSICNKLFSNRQNRWKHETKVCKKKNYEDKLEKLEKEIKILKNVNNKNDIIKFSNDKEVKKNQEINGDHNIINSINVINNFNNDNLAYITPDFFKNLLKETLFEEDHYKVLPKVIEEVKFNKEHFENNNVKLKDKSKYGEVYTEGGWKKIDDKKLIELLVQKGYQLYVKLTDIHKDQIIKRYIDSNESFKDNFLNGGIENEVEESMKETIINGTKKIKKYDPKEREKELMKEIVL
jgi:hypothetical protein